MFINDSRPKQPSSVIFRSNTELIHLKIDKVLAKRCEIAHYFEFAESLGTVLERTKIATLKCIGNL